MLRITRGDYREIPIRLPFDPTGMTVLFTVKPESDIAADDPTDEFAVIKGTADHDHVNADPENGLTVVPLLPEDTKAAVGEYVYDVQVIDAQGRPRTAKKRDGQLPRCEVTPESTQRTA